MSWTTLWTDNFEDNNLTDWTVGDGWTTVAGGLNGSNYSAKAAQTNSDRLLSRGFTASARVKLTFRIKPPSVNTRSGEIMLRNGATIVCTMRFFSDGYIYCYTSGSPTDHALTTFSANTEYLCVLDVDCATGKYTVTVNGVTYDNGGAGWAIENTATTIDTVRFNTYSSTGSSDILIDDVSVEAASGFTASGGTITVDGDHIVHRFTGTGLLLCTGTIPAEILMVGGGGGASYGGGGAGGYHKTALALLGAMPVVIGVGGTAGNDTTIGGVGGNTTFAGLTAYGGGGGGDHGRAGTSGASAGGAGYGSLQYGPIAKTLEPYGYQGNDGGRNWTGSGSYPQNKYPAGGGGGASAVGGDASSGTAPGTGGAGYDNDIVQRGVNVGYAGGGAGAACDGTIYGSATHGGGGNEAGRAGVANTGGGGCYWAAGGSGIVVIRYRFQNFPQTPTGGVITTDGDYTVHKFTTSDILEVPSGWTRQAQVMIIAGGGGGASGGGGAGGVIVDTVILAENLLARVGLGGSGQLDSGSYIQGVSGQDSIFGSLVAVGGGGGGNATVVNGSAGGSGGGESECGYSTAYDGGAGTVKQGFRGGKISTMNSPYHAGGGGGARGPGQCPTPPGYGGAGGPGFTSDIVQRGTNVDYAGGGGGSTYYSGSGPGAATHGGGAGGSGVGTAGTANTGGGGGGAGYSYRGGNGGSGIIVVRYRTAGGAPFTATGGIITTDGLYTVHKFTSDDTFACTGERAIEVLVVAGGGGGGGSSGRGGGGGGGGVLRGYVPAAGSMPVTVGAGGTGGISATSNSTAGGDSTFGGFTAKGGGRGGGEYSSGQAHSGGNGGNGGGEDAYYSGNIGGIGIQGFGGGLGVDNSYGAGGGGGAGAIGANGSGNNGGAGGAGINSDIVQAGSNVGYGGGGGGGFTGSGGSATHGGGAGGSGTGTAGTANTGGGGGGAASGAAGGTGVVIIRYLTPPVSAFKPVIILV